MCVFFAIAPTQWDDLIKTSTAFIRRLAGNWNKLDDFKKEDTKELIETYLQFSRIKNYNSQKVREKFPDCEPSLCPLLKNQSNQFKIIRRKNFTGFINLSKISRIFCIIILINFNQLAPLS